MKRILSTLLVVAFSFLCFSFSVCTTANGYSPSTDTGYKTTIILSTRTFPPHAPLGVYPVIAKYSVMEDIAFTHEPVTKENSPRLAVYKEPERRRGLIHKQIYPPEDQWRASQT